MNPGYSVICSDVTLVSVIKTFDIRICFGFRYSDFGFVLAGMSYPQRYGASYWTCLLAAQEGQSE
jgi:hypothetical protein